MGQSITSVPNPDGPLMRLRLNLRCDGEHNPIIPRAEYVAVGDDFIDMRRVATTRGWRRIEGGEWRGPCCKG